jgi:hypothetical protein
VALKKNNPTYCFKDLYGLPAYYDVDCIKETAKRNNDYKQCSNLWITYSASSRNLGNYNYTNYKDCVKNSMPDEDLLESNLIEGCKAIKIELSPLDSGTANTFKDLCFSGVAHEYNKPEYCNFLSDNKEAGASERAICLSVFK